MHCKFIVHSILLLCLHSASSYPNDPRQNPGTLQKPFKLRPKFDVGNQSQSLSFIHDNRGGDGDISKVDVSTDIRSVDLHKKIQKFILKNEFIIGMVSAVVLAKFVPQVGVFFF